MSDEDNSIKRSGSKVLRKGGYHKGSSGEHPVMQEVRKKLDSIREGTLSELEALNARIDKLKKKSDPPDESKDEGEEDTQPHLRVDTPAPET